ncbi:hypothetical protein K435DRAFT_798959 [Dendrothele bispora CBS 962.96]|uniref:Uncharacterized protein n=1 Tax=Dendrothele bispora (strain CBS 962.96) TaxID=1314807 RepID=A0A4S8LXK0_DENBC|nr:hypothetical protein K435DRAFT_798959 [Dendrothele bispora CBS 962.96]
MDPRLNVHRYLEELKLLTRCSKYFGPPVLKDLYSLEETSVHSELAPSSRKLKEKDLALGLSNPFTSTGHITKPFLQLLYASAGICIFFDNKVFIGSLPPYERDPGQIGTPMVLVSVVLVLVVPYGSNCLLGNPVLSTNYPATKLLTKAH